MKYLTQTILYGARLLHKSGDVSSKGLASLTHIIMNRRLQNAGSDLSSMLADSMGTEMTDQLEKCGIDVDDLYSKAIGAMMANGSALLDESATPHDKLEAEEAVFESLMDDDEQECSADEKSKITVAQKDFLGCLGIDNFLDSDKLFSNELPIWEEIKDECSFLSSKEMFETETTETAMLLLDEDSEVGKLSKSCVQKALGNNEIGNFIRHIWDNLDASGICLTKFSEELPHCYVRIPMEDGSELKLPLSLEKKLDCFVGGVLDDSFFADFCTSTFKALDNCLPSVDEHFIDDIIVESCDEEGVFVGKSEFLGMDSSVLTQNKMMPDFCFKVLDLEEDAAMEEVKARMEYFNAKRNYGWTVEKNDPEGATQALTSGLVVSTTVAESSETSPGQAASTSHLAFLPLALATIGVVVVGIALWFSRRSAGPSPPPSAFRYPEFDHEIA